MYDQRVEARPALGLIDARDGLGVGRVGGEPVYSLGRNPDRLAGEDQPRGFSDAVVGEGKDPRFHSNAAKGLVPMREVQARSRWISSAASIPSRRMRVRISGHSSLRKRVRSDSLRRARAPGATNMPTPRFTTISPSSWKPW